MAHAPRVDALQPGDTVQAEDYGLVRFERWDVYHGQRTAEITLLDFGNERRNPLPDDLQERIDRAATAREISDADVESIIGAFTERGVVPTDAQAHALAKRFRLTQVAWDDDSGKWEVGPQGIDCTADDCIDVDLNRAIAQCVVNIRKSGTLRG